MSRPDGDIVLLETVAECISRIANHTEGSKAHFMNSELVQDAVLHNLQVLSASTSRLSESIKASEPEVPWSEIRAFRNRLTHWYSTIDLDAVWEVVEQNLAELDDAVRRMRSRKTSA